MAKRRKSRRRSGAFGALGVAPLVLPIIGAVTAGKLAIAAIGGGALYLATRKQQTGPVPVPQVPDECSHENIQAALAATAAQTAGGAATGAAAGGVGAGIGAGVGAGLSVAANPSLAKCGLAAFNKAKQTLCTKADMVVSQIRARGGAVPAEYNRWSCDQKIAFVAALGPAGVAALLAGALVGRLATDTVNEVKRAVGNVQNAASSNAKGVEHAGQHVVNSVKHLFGLGPIGRYGVEEK